MQVIVRMYDWDNLRFGEYGKIYVKYDMTLVKISNAIMVNFEPNYGMKKVSICTSTSMD